jgi:hypothetical protein
MRKEEEIPLDQDQQQQQKKKKKQLIRNKSMSYPLFRSRKKYPQRNFSEISVDSVCLLVFFFLDQE